MNKKYFKIGFIIFFILFVIFIIIRKMSIDSQLESKTTLDKSSKVVTKELKKEPDPRIKIKLEDNTSNTSSKIKEEIKSPIISDEKVELKISTDKENLEQSSNEIKKEPQIVIDDNKALKKVEPTNKRKIEVKTLIVSEEIEVESIDDLKKIKNELLIDYKNNNFLFQNNQYKKGDYLGKFKVIKVEEKKIRFKKENSLYYSLRFY